jgi:hypothetical protein
MKLLGDVGHVECQFGPFGDCVSVGARFCAERAMSSEIVLDTHDGTAR